MAGEIPGIGMGYRLEVGVFFPQRNEIAIYNPEIVPFTEEGEYDYDGDGEPGGPRPEVQSNRVFAKWSLGLDYSIGPHILLNAQWVHGMTDEFGSGDFLRPRDWAVRQGSAVGWLPAEANGRPDILDCALNGKGGECAKEILRPKLADYLVFGVDFNFARNAGLIRVFTLWDLSGYHEQSYDIEQGERINVFRHPFTKEGFSAVIYPVFRYNFGYGFELEVGALFNLGRDYTKFGDPAGGGHQAFLKGRFSF